MPTWNTSKPATANSVAADVADIEENFDYLEDLLTYFFKTWSTSSATIGKNSIYYVNPAATDQGADDNARSAKDLIDAIGTDKNAILYFPHFSVDGNTTTFTFGTAETAYDNHTLIFENGVIIAGAGALSIQGTALFLGDSTLSGAITVASGGKLITFGTMTVTGTLTVQAGGKLVEIGKCVLSGAGSIVDAGARFLDCEVPYKKVDATNSTAAATEQTLFTHTLLANSMRNEKILRLVAHGKTAAGASGITIKAYFGSSSVTVGTTTSGSELGWRVDLIFAASNSDAASVLYNDAFSGVPQVNDTAFSSVDFTGTNVVKITATLGDALYSATCYAGYIQIL